MTRTGLLLAAVFAAGGLAGWLFATREPAAGAQPPAATPAPQPPAPAGQPPAKAEEAEAGVKVITAEYQTAFNAADAKAAAMLWTERGEYEGADGLLIQGRAEIEKSLGAFFKAHSKATAEIRIESVKLMGRGLATAGGVVALKTPGAEEVVESRYLALHTLQEGKWLAVSVKEWVPNPATDVTPKHLDWLIGEWTATGDAGAEVKIVYEWGEEKTFLTGKYTVMKDGKKVSSGTQVIGVNPGGGLRSWMFDSTGTTSDGIWLRDDKRWVNESVGMLPDGTEVLAVNVIIPLGPDAFTWQTAEREINGAAAGALPPIKVTRVNTTAQAVITYLAAVPVRRTAACGD